MLLLSCLYSGAFVILVTGLKLLQNHAIILNMFKCKIKYFRLPEEFASDVCKVVYGPARPDIDSQLIAASPSLPHLSNLEWRVEVTISTRFVHIKKFK